MNTQTLTTLLSSLTAVLGTVTIIIAMVLVLPRVDRWLDVSESVARSQAIDGCAQVSLNTFSDTNKDSQSMITDLNQTVYTNCLELKNIAQ